jgi:hypothetical protein
MSIDELVSRRYRKNMEWLMSGIVRSLALFDMLEMREYNVALNLKCKTPAAAHTFIIGLSATYEEIVSCGLKELDENVLNPCWSLRFTAPRTMHLATIELSFDPQSLHGHKCMKKLYNSPKFFNSLFSDT